MRRLICGALILFAMSCGAFEDDETDPRVVAEETRRQECLAEDPANEFLDGVCVRPVTCPTGTLLDPATGFCVTQVDPPEPEPLACETRNQGLQAALTCERIEASTFACESGDGMTRTRAERDDFVEACTERVGNLLSGAFSDVCQAEADTATFLGWSCDIQLACWDDVNGATGCGLSL